MFLDKFNTCENAISAGEYIFLVSSNLFLRLIIFTPFSLKNLTSICSIPTEGVAITFIFDSLVHTSLLNFKLVGTKTIS